MLGGGGVSTWHLGLKWVGGALPFPAPQPQSHHPSPPPYRRPQGWIDKAASRVTSRASPPPLPPFAMPLPPPDPAPPSRMAFKTPRPSPPPAPLPPPLLWLRCLYIANPVSPPFKADILISPTIPSSCPRPLSGLGESVGRLVIHSLIPSSTTTSSLPYRWTGSHELSPLPFPGATASLLGYS